MCYFSLEVFNVLLLLGKGFLCGRHSLDEFSDFDVMFVGSCGAEWSEEESFKDHIFQLIIIVFGCIKILIQLQPWIKIFN